MNKTTETVLNELKQTETTANLDTDGVPFATRQAHQMAKGQAKNALPALRKEYQQKILTNSIAFVVSGPKAQEFATVAQKVAPAVQVLDASLLYRDLGNKIESIMGPSREFGMHQYLALIQGLREAAAGAGVQLAIQAPQFGGVTICRTREDVMVHVKNLALQTEGGAAALGTLYLTKQAVNNAVESNFAGNVLVAVVLNALPGQEQELAGVFTHQFPVETTEDEVTEEYVLKTFETAKRNRNKKQKQ